MKRLATMNHKKHKARQRLWFLASFTAAVFLIHKDNLTIPETRELMRMIPPSDQSTRGQKVTLTKHCKPCSDIHGKRLVVLYVLVL